MRSISVPLFRSHGLPVCLHPPSEVAAQIPYLLGSLRQHHVLILTKREKKKYNEYKKVLEFLDQVKYFFLQKNEELDRAQGTTKYKKQSKTEQKPKKKNRFD